MEQRKGAEELEKKMSVLDTELLQVWIWRFIISFIVTKMDGNTQIKINNFFF